MVIVFPLNRGFVQSLTSTITIWVTGNSGQITNNKKTVEI